ncbi:MAG: hypothetical protein KAS11_04825 [Candidatus Aenigmarchaeota archaeon]|nr:hypothetical protein [Candidatus Aenigmarchaeota archaeon]
MDENAETLTEQRDRLNSKVKELILKSKDISAHIGGMHEVSDPMRKQEKKMDKIAAALQGSLKKLKSEKKDIAKELKTLSLSLESFGMGKPSDFRKTIEELKKLDWMVQTEVMSAKREDALSRKVIELEKKAKGYNQYSKIKDGMDLLQEKIADIAYAAEMHGDLITDALDRKYKLQGTIFKNMRKLKKDHMKLKKTNDAINKTKKEADEAHGKLMVLLKSRKAERSVFKKQKEEDVRKAKVREDKDIEKSHDSLFEQLKKKGKISLG